MHIHTLLLTMLTALAIWCSPPSLLALETTSTTSVSTPAASDLQKNTTPPTRSWFQVLRAELPHHHRMGQVRVFYDTAGEHAVDGADLNQNGVPDQVEDIATQAWATLLLWESLGLPHPLSTPRYQSAEWIDIHLLARETIKANGLAYDELTRFGRKIDPPGTLTLCVDVATSVKAHKNLTPAHEMFHVVQNSLSYFKNSWYTEGTARWSEQALGRSGRTENALPEVWPPSDAELNEIYASSYTSAQTYWAPMIRRYSQETKLPVDRLPKELLNATYTDGSPVLADHALAGWDLIRDILLALGPADQLARQSRDLKDWPESEQHSAKNTPYIQQAIDQVLQAYAEREK